MQQVTRCLAFVWLLSNYCAALYTENLTLLEILVMILQGTASVDLLGNVAVFASKYKLLLCLLSSFFLQGQILGVWGERKKEEDPARHWGSTRHTGWKL